MSELITTQQLLDKFGEFSELFCEFRNQNCKAESVGDLTTLQTYYESLGAHLRTAITQAGVLKSAAFKLGKILMVCSKGVKITYGWESHVNYTWRADSKVGQKRARTDVLKSHCVVFLYDPETDSVEDVTEIFRNTEDFVQFN